MNKLLSSLLIILLLVSCTNKKQEPIINNPEPVTITEKVYILPNDWIVYDFDFVDEAATYQLKDGLYLTFIGQEKEEPYCQSSTCIVYDNITANDKHLVPVENMSVKVNQDYGSLHLYNLNNELYLLAFDPAAQYSLYYCIVFDDEGNVIKDLGLKSLTMNTEYQNTFLIAELDETGNEISTKIYTANGKILEETDF